MDVPTTLDHRSAVEAVEAESRHLIDTVHQARSLGPSTGRQPVPTCPDWGFDDLVWHMCEVQHFWGSIVEDRLDDPEAVVDLDRPPSAALPELLERPRGAWSPPCGPPARTTGAGAGTPTVTGSAGWPDARPTRP